MLPFLVLATCFSHSLASPARPWLDASLPIPARVAALLPQLSPSEKLHQLLRADASASIASLAATGIGLLECGALSDGARAPSDFARARNAAVAAFLAAGPGARLGVPPAFRTLAIHGGEAFGTVFPEGPGLGATWNAPLAAALGAAGAAEARALGIDLVTFVINLWGDARFGRQEEGLSEEPTLSAILGAALAAGAQGPPGAAPAGTFDYILPPYAPALFKHVGAYGGAAGGVNGGRADAPEHVVREKYLKPWRAVAAAGARGAMPSHNTVLGTPAHASVWLLSGRLRGEFKQSNALILSDTGDVLALSGFRLCADDAACAALALSAGVDIEQPPGTTYLSLADAIQRNLTTAAAVDAAVGRVLAHKFSAGLFDTPLVNASAADAVVGSAAHRALARRAATEGAVLLINDGALPLARGARVAVIGPLGSDAKALLGNYAPGPAPLTGVLSLAAAVSASGFAASVAVERGANVSDDDEAGFPAALAAARAADVVILAVGDDLASSAEGGDRDDLDLPGGQTALLRALVAANLTAPIIVVLVNGRTATFGASDGNAALRGVSGLLVAWRPGQEGGAAIADLLWGVANPSGRLPNQWTAAVGRAGGPDSPWAVERAAGWAGARGAEGRGYAKYYNSAAPAGPLFVFGEGLSYASYSIAGGLAIVDAPGNATHPWRARTAVASAAGARFMAGDCVVQFFVIDPVGVTGRIVRPWKRLVAFARAAVVPGMQTAIDIPIAAADVAMVDEAGEFRVVPGTYVFTAGLRSDGDAGATAQVVIA